ncbi:hypothetical protein QUC31_017193, partial [Theobroma cacao]
MELRDMFPNCRDKVGKIGGRLQSMALTGCKPKTCAGSPSSQPSDIVSIWTEDESSGFMDLEMKR